MRYTIDIQPEGEINKQKNEAKRAELRGYLVVPLQEKSSEQSRQTNHME